MKKLPVLTCKNNHALISKAIPLLIASFLLASTFIITSPLLAQPATSRSSFGPHKNNKGYTFNLTHDSDLSKNQDGWCQPGSDSKTFNCTLNFDKSLILSENGDGSSMKHGSPSPTAATNPVPFCWPSWYPSHPDLRTDAGNYSYYCGFFVADAQDMAAHKNAGGYYFTFSSKVQQYQDGWCVPVQDKTYLCYLLNGSTKDNNIHYSKRNGQGAGMKDSSPTPLYEGEQPYCWPDSIVASNPAKNYYCGFFKKEVQTPQ